MLTYLINVTDDMLFVSLVLGVILAVMDTRSGKAGKIITRSGLAAGFIIAAVRSYITNTRRLVGGWKVGTYGYGAALALFVLLIAAFIIFGKKFLTKKGKPGLVKASEIIISTVTALLIASYLYCAMPNVYVYPFKFDTGGNGVLSTDYLFRLEGYLAGIIVCLVSAVSAYKLISVAMIKGSKKLSVISFFLLNTMLAVYNFAKLMLVLTPRKIVDSVELFNFASISNNLAHWYTFAAFTILAVIGIVIWVRSYTSKEPYSTNAQHRKQRSVWRTGKRYSVTLFCCFVVAVLCATWFVELNKEVIREAPTEEPVITQNADGTDKELRVPLETVSDGHLHRFGYTTPEGYPTRFIVVLKQENTGNYGIGLDACEICGEAGYYENKDGQVVCKKCGVVMNKTTIGMKGGCNPIIIDYDIADGEIIIPAQEMVKNQAHFKK